MAVNRIRPPSPWAGFPLVMEHDILGAKEVVRDDGTGAITLMAFTGHDRAGEPLAKIVVDLPDRRYYNQRLSNDRKVNQELHDVWSFLEAAYGHPFTADELTPGPDRNAPPDVRVCSRSLALDVETTQLLLPGTGGGQNSVSKWSLFEQVNDWLVDQSNRLAGRLRTYRGHVVYLWFTDGSSEMQQLPPRRIAADVAAFLAAQSPSTAPTDRILKSDDGRIQATWLPARPSRQPSAFERLYGFRLGISYDQVLTRKAFRAELQRLVKQHDKPGFDVLLITLGTPTRAGWRFPSAGLLSAALQAEPDPLNGLAPKHVERLAVYDGHESAVRWLVGSP